jgi:anthranilate/para-aminobenzoate synthase component I
MTFLQTAPRTRADITPSREEIHELFQQGDMVPVYRRLLADLETPVSVYLKLAQTGDVSFLLESVEGGEQVGRYSFLGVNPSGVVTFKDGQITRQQGRPGHHTGFARRRRPARCAQDRAGGS